MANQAYNKAKNLMMQNELDLVNDDIKIILVVGYTPDIDNHDFYSDVSAYETTGAGYTSGGQELSGRTFERDDLNDRTEFQADDVIWETSTISANGAIIYKDTGTLTTSPLVAFVDFESGKSSDGTDFKIEWSDQEGVIYLT